MWNPRGGSYFHCLSIELELGNVCFCEERKSGEPGKKPLEQGQEQTTNSTHIYTIFMSYFFVVDLSKYCVTLGE